MADTGKKKNVTFKSEDKAREWQYGFTVNTTTVCYYHKKNNLDVVFDRSSSKKVIGKSIVLAVVLCILLSFSGPGIAFVIYWIVKNNNSNLPRDATTSNEPRSGWFFPYHFLYL